jgi:hypothetical protein
VLITSLRGERALLARLSRIVSWLDGTFPLRIDGLEDNGSVETLVSVVCKSAVKLFEFRTFSVDVWGFVISLSAVCHGKLMGKGSDRRFKV